MDKFLDTNIQDDLRRLEDSATDKEKLLIGEIKEKTKKTVEFLIHDLEQKNPTPTPIAEIVQLKNLSNEYFSNILGIPPNLIIIGHSEDKGYNEQHRAILDAICEPFKEIHNLYSKFVVVSYGSAQRYAGQIPSGGELPKDVDLIVLVDDKIKFDTEVSDKLSPISKGLYKRMTSTPDSEDGVKLTFKLEGDTITRDHRLSLLFGTIEGHKTDINRSHEDKANLLKTITDRSEGEQKQKAIKYQAKNTLIADDIKSEGVVILGDPQILE